MRVNYSIILVSSMERSVAFYRDVVGMPLKFESPGWSEFNTDGATWALHKCDQTAPSSDRWQAETAGQCRPGFQILDLSTFHARMLEHNVPCAREPEETFGTRIAQYVDPDGLIFSVAEAMPTE